MAKNNVFTGPLRSEPNFSTNALTCITTYLQHLCYVMYMMCKAAPIALIAFPFLQGPTDALDPNCRIRNQPAAIIMTKITKRQGSKILSFCSPRLMQKTMTELYMKRAFNQSLFFHLLKESCHFQGKLTSYLFLFGDTVTHKTIERKSQYTKQFLEILCQENKQTATQSLKRISAQITALAK